MKGKERKPSIPFDTYMYLYLAKVSYIHTHTHTHTHIYFPGGSVVKNLPAKPRDARLFPRSGRSPGGGNGNQLQCSCLGNPMERGAGQTTVHKAAKSWTWLSEWARIHVYPGVYVLSLHLYIQYSSFQIPNILHCLFLQVISPSRKRVTSFQIETKIRT